jgi:hypothetical protein
MQTWLITWRASLWAREENFWVLHLQAAKVVFLVFIKLGQAH